MNRDDALLAWWAKREWHLILKYIWESGFRRRACCSLGQTWLNFLNLQKARQKWRKSKNNKIKIPILKVTLKSQSGKSSKKSGGRKVENKFICPHCGYGYEHPRTLKNFLLKLFRKLPKVPDKPCPMCQYYLYVAEKNPHVRRADFHNNKPVENPWSRRNWTPPSHLWRSLSRSSTWIWVCVLFVGKLRSKSKERSNPTGILSVWTVGTPGRPSWSLRLTKAAWRRQQTFLIISRPWSATNYKYPFWWYI